MKVALQKPLYHVWCVKRRPNNVGIFKIIEIESWPGSCKGCCAPKPFPKYWSDFCLTNWHQVAAPAHVDSVSLSLIVSILPWWQGAPSFSQRLAWHQLEQTCSPKTTHLQNFRSKLQTYHYSTTLRPSAPSVGSLSRESDIIQFPPAPQRNDPPRPWRDTIPPPAWDSHG